MKLYVLRLPDARCYCRYWMSQTLPCCDNVCDTHTHANYFQRMTVTKKKGNAWANKYKKFCESFEIDMTFDNLLILFIHFFLSRRVFVVVINIKIVAHVKKCVCLWCLWEWEWERERERQKKNWTYWWHRCQFHRCFGIDGRKSAVPAFRVRAVNLSRRRVSMCQSFESRCISYAFDARQFSSIAHCSKNIGRSSKCALCVSSVWSNTKSAICSVQITAATFDWSPGQITCDILYFVLIRFTLIHQRFGIRIGATRFLFCHTWIVQNAMAQKLSIQKLLHCHAMHNSNVSNCDKFFYHLLILEFIQHISVCKSDFSCL